MERALPLAVAFALLGCSGPPAPDAALCKDVLHRLCLPPVCPVVTERFAEEKGCEQTLTERTGCDDDAFAFTEEAREEFIACRNILVRTGLEPERAPACEDVDAMLNQCGDLVTFLGGR